jgi:hypothetical protein
VFTPIFAIFDSASRKPVRRCFSPSHNASDRRTPMKRRRYYANCPPGAVLRRARLKPRRRPSTSNETISGRLVCVKIPPVPNSLRRAPLSYIEPKPGSEPPCPSPVRSLPGTDAFVVFGCRWPGCVSKLHNLYTLRKHIRRLHKDESFNPGTGLFSCRWDQCGEIDAFIDGPAWEQHFDEVHLSNLKKQLGDGPTIHPAGKSAMHPQLRSDILAYNGANANCRG